MTARKSKADASKAVGKPVQDIVPIEIVDRVNRANQIVKSTCAAMCEMGGGGADFRPMVRAALNEAAAELDAAKALLGR